MSAQYGLIGRRIGHSFSERFFGEKFRREGIDASYGLFPLPSIDELPALIQSMPQLQGFNVTIPYKEEVMVYLDSLDPEAQEVGAVNCVKIENGKLRGYNTDVYGFRNSLLGFLGEERPYALVLGTGGAAKAVTYVLRGLGIDYISVSRSGKDGAVTYEDLIADADIVGSHRLIVNTTPLGTYPDVDSAPVIPWEAVLPVHYLFDLVYNPEQTLFMKKGAALGARVMNGYEMLVGQAERSWEIWVPGGTRE
jgi:shikimate dehydrogenase